MARNFEMIPFYSDNHWQQADDISDMYFTVDTAHPADVRSWAMHNRMLMTYAIHEGKVLGFTNLMPLTREAGLLFERNAIREEELTPEHILAPDVMHYAEYFYLPGIAVSNYQSYKAHQCAAALMSVLAYALLNFYDRKRLKKIFVNPTTFQGNRMTRKLGLQRLAAHNNRMLTGSDLYYATFDKELFQNLERIEQRYRRFVRSNWWQDPEWIAKMTAMHETRE